MRLRLIFQFPSVQYCILRRILLECVGVIVGGGMSGQLCVRTYVCLCVVSKMGAFFVLSFLLEFRHNSRIMNILNIF